MLTCVYIYLINKYKCFLDINVWMKLVFDDKYLQQRNREDVIAYCIAISTRMLRDM